MATKTLRSPRYPQVGLREAIDKVAAVYKSDYRNKIPKELVAEHMGYSGLNGASLGIISAVSKYGLLDGGREAMWVTPLAIDILERERDDPVRISAIREAASTPELFRDLEESFPEKVSDAALRSHLITKRQFLPDSALKLIRAFRETQEFVEGECRDVPVRGDDPVPEAISSTRLDVGSGVSAGIVGQGPLATMTISQAAAAMERADVALQPHEREWLRGPLSRSTSYRLLISGEMGPKEIAKLIKLLQAQREILEDDVDDDLVG